MNCNMPDFKVYKLKMAVYFLRETGEKLHGLMSRFDAVNGF